MPKRKNMRTPVLRAYRSGKTTIVFADAMIRVWCDWVRAERPLDLDWFKLQPMYGPPGFIRDCMLTIDEQRSDFATEANNYPTWQLLVA